MGEAIKQRMITVFGGSRCAADSDEYLEAIKLGRLLAEEGFDVCSGGYSGIMEAISRGVHEAGGHATGFTMEQFKASPNPYLKKIVPSRDFYERLQSLIRESAGYIALRGGMGTLTEISLVWNKLQTRVLSPRPLILLGECWQPAITGLRQHLVISDDDMSLLSFAATAEEAIAILMGRLL